MPRQFVISTDSTDHAASAGPDFSGELNPRQLEAATWPGGPLLIIAGAGTGKTRTLVHRVAWLIGSGVLPEHITLLTFTRRAASQMLTRASTLLDGRCQRVRGGTFHAFCLTVLKEHAHRIGFRNGFTILDASDAADVIDIVRSTHATSKQGKRFPKKRALIQIASSMRNRGRSLSETLESGWPQFLEYEEMISAVIDGYRVYKRQQGLMDYDDLLGMTLELFDTHPDILQQVATLCRHVLVDEYQDTNQAQARLVEAFASVHGNVTVVGDDAQSIYRFRGAEPKNIFAFPSRWPGTQVVKLEHNYRSTQSVLDLANTILEQAHRRYEKRLFTERGKGDLPVLIPTPDDRFESRFVSQMVLQFREQGIALNQMAVLFRNGNASYDLEVELNKRGIPFVKYGGLKLSEAAHIKDILAHLRVLENPRDVVAWNRVLQLLEGIGPKTAGRIVEHVRGHLAEQTSEDGTVGSTWSLSDMPVSASYRDALVRLFATFEQMRKPDQTMSQQLETLYTYYLPVLTSAYTDDWTKREPDLEHLAAVAARFADRSSLLDALALDPIERTVAEVEEQQPDEPPLVLSTIHSAKGLEFKVVFLIQALEGVLPSAYSVGSTDALDEELRLLYVAVTRAKDHLFISYPMIQFRRQEGQYFTKPSRFLADIPGRILEPGTLVESSEAVGPDSMRPNPNTQSSPDALPF